MEAKQGTWREISEGLISAHLRRRSRRLREEASTDVGAEIRLVCRCLRSELICSLPCTKTSQCPMQLSTQIVGRCPMKLHDDLSSDAADQPCDALDRISLSRLGLRLLCPPITTRPPIRHSRGTRESRSHPKCLRSRAQAGKFEARPRSVPTRRTAPAAIRGAAR